MMNSNLKTKLKQSITTIEVIFSLVILAVLLITSSNIILQLNEKNNTTKENLHVIIDFESTRLFLEKKIKYDHSLSSIEYNDKVLYYNDDILLNNVTSFKKINTINTIKIDLCIKYSIEICQKIIIKT